MPPISTLLRSRAQLLTTLIPRCVDIKWIKFRLPTPTIQFLAPLILVCLWGCHRAILTKQGTTFNELWKEELCQNFYKLRSLFLELNFLQKSNTCFKLAIRKPIMPHNK
jgi:hypothetical protein